jgi:hypothetical protein
VWHSAIAEIASGANSSSVPSVSSLCISPASFVSSTHAAERKSRELEVENAMAEGGVKVSRYASLQSLRLRAELSQFQLERPSQLCSNSNAQALLLIAHRRAAASKKVRKTLPGKIGGVKCWRIVRMDMRSFQFLVGHLIEWLALTVASIIAAWREPCQNANAAFPVTLFDRNNDAFLLMHLAQLHSLPFPSQRP